MPLVKQILADVKEIRDSERAKTKIYFTKGISGITFLTLESHLYTLLNCIFESGIPTKIQRNELPEVDYLTQVSFEIWERTSPSVTSPIIPSGLPTMSTFFPSGRTPISVIPIRPSVVGTTIPPTAYSFGALIPTPPVSVTPAPTTANKYSLRIGFSPGCTVNDPLDIQLDSKHCINVAPRRSLTSHLDVEVVKDLLTKRFSRVELPKRFLPVSIRGELGKGIASVPWSNDVSDEASDAGGDVAGEKTLEREIHSRPT